MEGTIFASGNLERLQRLTMMWDLSGKGPNKPRETESQGRSGMGVLERGTLIGFLVCIWHSFVACFQGDF